MKESNESIPVPPQILRARSKNRPPVRGPATSSAVRRKRTGSPFNWSNHRALSMGALYAVSRCSVLKDRFFLDAANRFQQLRGLVEMDEVLAWLIRVAGPEAPAVGVDDERWSEALAARVTRALLQRAVGIWENLRPRYTQVARRTVMAPGTALASYYSTRFVDLVESLRCAYWWPLTVYYSQVDDIPGVWRVTWPEICSELV
jgi:hypothetical protein